MLRANVGLSRKVSKDYNSTGFSINLEGEIIAPSSDAEAVVEQVKELFDLAEEALARQVERTQGNDAIAGRDESPAAPQRQNGNSRQTAANGNGNGQDNGPEIATDKQVNFLLAIGKRQRLSTVQLERKIEEVLGRQVGLYDLTKREAATVLDALTGGTKSVQTSDRR